MLIGKEPQKDTVGKRTFNTNVKATKQIFFRHTSPAKIWKCHSGASCISVDLTEGAWCFPHWLVRVPFPTGAWARGQPQGRRQQGAGDTPISAVSHPTPCFHGSAL